MFDFSVKRDFIKGPVLGDSSQHFRKDMILIFVIAYIESFRASHLIVFWISVVRMVFLKNIALCKFSSFLKSALLHSVVVTALPSLSTFGKLIQKLFWFIIVRFCCFETNKWKTFITFKQFYYFQKNNMKRIWEGV